MPPLTRFADIFTVTQSKVDFFTEEGQDYVHFLADMANKSRAEGFYSGTGSGPGFSIDSLVAREYVFYQIAFNFIAFDGSYVVGNMDAFQKGGETSAAFLLSRNDEVYGTTGADYLDGYGGVDKLYGQEGADTLDGGLGADTMTGGKDSDTYFVDDAGDTIVEVAGGGTADWVRAAVTFDLLSGVDVERLSTTNDKGTAKINLYGNEVAQTITGNAAANILSDGGKGGSDTLIGLGGNDTYRVYNSGTKIVEGSAAGSDTVEAAVNYTVGKGVYIQVLETTNAKGTAALSLYSNEFGQTVNGNAGANVLRGYGGNDTINGGAGNDKISGGEGKDTLAGNTGADTYYFSNALGASNVDTIKGFSSIDLISLNASIFTKAGPAGTLAASAFVANTSGKAGDASDRIIYETDTGILRYDPDGTGAAAATAFAIIDNKFAMNAGDFVIA